MAEIQKFTHEDWLAEADRRFGTDAKDWKFVCPRCETVQSIRDFLEAEVPKETIDGVIGFSCIGRFTDAKGCDWTLGGLFRIHKAVVVKDGKEHPIFEFAEVEVKVDGE